MMTGLRSTSASFAWQAPYFVRGEMVTEVPLRACARGVGVGGVSCPVIDNRKNTRIQEKLPRCLVGYPGCKYGYTRVSIVF